MNTFVLVDCNNFYVSCERLFNPALENRPVLVLSSNDGCVVARSQEVKQLGIKMGEPFFKIKDLCRAHDILVFSSNYQLYGNLSQRVMHLLSEAAEDIQIYSIDEAFLTFANMPPEQLVRFSIEMRRNIKQCVGIPTSIGIAPTKTLAKIANDLAKKDRSYGIFDICEKEVQDQILKDFAVEKIWGIGTQLMKKLHAMGIYTAEELRQQDPVMIRKKMGVYGERILWELRGISCLQLEEAQPKKSITCSRSFGAVITSKSEIAEAVATHVDSACRKLRDQQCAAQAISVYLEALIDSKTNVRQTFNTTLPFPIPTNDTPYIISLAKRGVNALFHQGMRYKKCGVILLDFTPEQLVIPDLLLGSIDPKRRHLADTLDALNAHFGKNTVFYGAMGINSAWAARSANRSDKYTSDWGSLAIAKA